MASPLEWIALGRLLENPSLLADVSHELFPTLGTVVQALQQTPPDKEPLRELLSQNGCVWTDKTRAVDAVYESLLDAAIVAAANKLSVARLLEERTSRMVVQATGNTMTELEAKVASLRARSAAARCTSDSGATTALGSGVAAKDTNSVPDAARTSKKHSPSRSTPPKSPPPSKPDSTDSPQFKGK